MPDTTRSSFLHRHAACVAIALAAFVAVASPAWSQTDITDSALPHTADSVFSDRYDCYAPSNLSNNLLGLYYGSWHSGDERNGNSFPHWVQIDFGSPRTVTRLNILAFSEVDSGYVRLKEFRFEGSNDGITYTPLHQGLCVYADVHVWQSFYFQNTAGYRYYRVYGLNNWRCGDYCEQMIIEEWEMFEGAPVPSDAGSWGRLKFLLR